MEKSHLYNVVLKTDIEHNNRKSKRKKAGMKNEMVVKGQANPDSDRQRAKFDSFPCLIEKVHPSKLNTFSLRALGAEVINQNINTTNSCHLQGRSTA